MTPNELSKAFESTDEKGVLLLMLIAIGKNQIKFQEEFLGWHRSTISKKADDLKNLGLVSISDKPGTEKKYRPTKLFNLTPGLSLDMIQKAAAERGINIDKEIEAVRPKAIYPSDPTLASNVAETEPEHPENSAEKSSEMNVFDPIMSNPPYNVSKLGQPLNTRLPMRQQILPLHPQRLPSLPEYDPTWPDETKAEWMKAYNRLLDRLQP